MEPYKRLEPGNAAASQLRLSFQREQSGKIVDDCDHYLELRYSRDYRSLEISIPVTNWHPYSKSILHVKAPSEADGDHRYQPQKQITIGLSASVDNFALKLQSGIDSLSTNIIFNIAL